MTTVFLAPDPLNSTQFIPGGNTPASGGQLFCYRQGSSNKQDMYTDVTGTTKYTNPLVLDSGGNIGGSNEIWIPAGLPAKFVLAPSNDTDPPLSPYWTRDNITGVNDTTATISEWIAGPAPTFVSATSFTLVGDQTAIFTPGRRIKTTNTSGTIYSTISSSIFTATTLVTVSNDSGTLDSGLSATFYGILNPKNTSLPLIVSVLNFGAKGDGVTDDTAAFVAALAAADEVIVPDATYILTAGTNFAAAGKSLIGIGKPILDYSAGTGIGFKLDAGGSGANFRNMRVENFFIKGGVNITDIFYSRGIVTSQFRNISVREGTTTGFALKFAVLNTYQDCRVSNDELAMTTSPATYWSLDTDGTAGNRCQANTFIDCDVSGKGASSTSTGYKLIDATLNCFYGGTSESVQRGIDIAAGCRLNTFIGMDTENNVNEDILDAGTGTSYVNFSSAGGGANAGTQITGDGAVFSGGAYSIINFGAASTDNSLHGVGIASAGGITGTGTYTRYGCYTLDNSGLRDGTLGDIAQGTALSNDAPAGCVGEYKETVVASTGVSLSTGTSKTVGSVSLTAGDWDVSGNIVFTGNAATTVTQLRGGASQTDNTLGISNTTFTEPYVGGVLIFGANDPSYPIPSLRLSLGSTTTVYLVANAVFAVNSCNAYGIIWARRRR